MSGTVIGNSIVIDGEVTGSDDVVVLAEGLVVPRVLAVLAGPLLEALEVRDDQAHVEVLVHAVDHHVADVCTYHVTCSLRCTKLGFTARHASSKQLRLHISKMML